MRVVLLLGLTLSSLPVLAQTDTSVRRCIGSDGGVIFTDQPCERLGAKDSITPDDFADPSGASKHPALSTSESSQLNTGPVNQDCARTPEALVEALKAPLKQRDINALAGFYHWPGMGTGSARAVMDRLETLLAHADGRLELVYPEAAFVVFDPETFPGIPPEDPIALRVGLAPDAFNPLAGEVDLRVVRASGCWWLHF
ncbi:MAG TPA: hypothetical protein VFN29_07350 [Chiayiivirga sp.]|nr:hypothetical protein [Chiayiivirga sp.]